MQVSEGRADKGGKSTKTAASTARTRTTVTGDHGPRSTYTTVRQLTGHLRRSTRNRPGAQRIRAAPAALRQPAIHRLRSNPSDTATSSGCAPALTCSTARARSTSSVRRSNFRRSLSRVGRSCQITSWESTYLRAPRYPSGLLTVPRWTRSRSALVEFDIRAFFDSVRWDLVSKAVEAVCDVSRVRLYVKPWLAAPVQQPDGTMVPGKGTPRGSPVSPRWQTCSFGPAKAEYLRGSGRLVRAGVDQVADRTALSCHAGTSARPSSSVASAVNRETGRSTPWSAWTPARSASGGYATV